MNTMVKANVQGGEMTRFLLGMISTGIGVPALVVFGYYTNWEAAVALFVALWANNLSQG